MSIEPIKHIIHYPESVPGSFASEFESLEFEEGIFNYGADENGKFSYFENRGIILSTNEMCSDVKESLSTLPQSGDTIIGVSNFHLFEIFLQREAAGALFVINIDPQLQMGNFFREFHRLIEKNSDPHPFLVELEIHLTKNLPLYFSEEDRRFHAKIEKRPFAEIIHEELESLAATLFENDGFLRLQALFRDRRFIHLPIDLQQDPNRAPELMHTLLNNGHHPDLVYVSNVEDYIPDERKGAFLENIAALTNCSAPIVSASFDAGTGLTPQSLETFHEFNEARI